jgi:hypothetical protein
MMSRATKTYNRLGGSPAEVHEVLIGRVVLSDCREVEPQPMVVARPLLP